MNLNINVNIDDSYANYIDTIRESTDKEYDKCRKDGVNVNVTSVDYQKA